MPRKTQPAADEQTDPGHGVAELSFEAAIDELESIVAGMERGELSLEESLRAYQRGAALVTRCRGALDAVGEQVKVLEGGLLKPMPEPTDEAPGTN